jgi:DNA-binding transcriptional regulator YiaG
MIGDNMSTATQSACRTGSPSADFSAIVKAAFLFVQKGARRLVKLSKPEWERLENLAVQLKDANEEERLEIVETILEVVLPEDLIGGVGHSKADAATKRKVMAFQQSIGSEIRKRRKALRMTQQTLAVKSGLPQSHVSRIECGEHTPSDLTVEKLSRALGAKPSEIDPGYPDS